MYILDSDHIGILQRKRGFEFDRILSRISAVGETNIFVTIISFHEQISGWTKYVKNSNDQSKIVTGYFRFEKILRDFAESQVLPYSTASSDIFEDIKKQKIRIATMDLRIASIVIAQRMVLVTRNTIDFERVPNLNFEDW